MKLTKQPYLYQQHKQKATETTPANQQSNNPTNQHPAPTTTTETELEENKTLQTTLRIIYKLKDNNKNRFWRET
jgi:hypothetical protein